MAEIIAEFARKRVEKILARQEEIIEAFVAKTGIQPDKCTLVIKYGDFREEFNYIQRTSDRVIMDELIADRDAARAIARKLKGELDEARKELEELHNKRIETEVSDERTP